MSPDDAAKGPLPAHDRRLELSEDTALLWAVAGMPSPETSEIMPDRNAVQTPSPETSEIMPDRNAVQTLVAARGPGEALTEQD